MMSTPVCLLVVCVCVGLLTGSLPSASAQSSLPAPSNLQVEYMANALGIDTLQPTFTWALPPGASRLGPSAYQSSYRVQVWQQATGHSVYDSGQQLGWAPIHHTASDLPLQSDTAYSWQLTVMPGSRQANATFTTGLLRQSDWAAVWLTGQNLMRTVFNVSPSTAASLGRATLFVSACQYYEAYLDGVRIGVS